MLDIYEQDWYTRGPCNGRDIDPDTFFPEGTPGYSGYDQIVDEAKAICLGCPVIAECLRWAVDSRQEYGVWGATEQNERVAMMRRASQAGSLAVNRYATNTEISAMIAAALEREVAYVKHLAELDEDARQRVLQKQG
ncbi:MAG: WhiB family transcriptional regulator [Patescibacteria group bacterium]